MDYSREKLQNKIQQVLDHVDQCNSNNSSLNNDAIVI